MRKTQKEIFGTQPSYSPVLFDLLSAVDSESNHFFMKVRNVQNKRTF